MKSELLWIYILYIDQGTCMKVWEQASATHAKKTLFINSNITNE